MCDFFYDLGKMSPITFVPKYTQIELNVSSSSSEVDHHKDRTENY